MVSHVEKSKSNFPDNEKRGMWSGEEPKIGHNDNFVIILTFIFNINSIGQITYFLSI